MTKAKRRLNFDAPRELLLVEIARRCRACDAQARIGLTKAEARDYAGFECEACDEWNEDDLSESDVPEWWEELRVTGLSTLRARADDHADSREDEAEAVRRLSDAWREDVRGDERATEVSSGGATDKSLLDGSSDDSSDCSSSGSSSEDIF